jgi:hypothetical protein
VTTVLLVLGVLAAVWLLRAIVAVIYHRWKYGKSWNQRMDELAQKLREP